MAHINSLTAVKYTRLDYSTASRTGTGWDDGRPSATGTRPQAARWLSLFEGTGAGTGESFAVTFNNTAATGASSVGSIREFPSLGTPANIVNVPVYGQSISSQVGGQADAPTLEFTLNYVPSTHAAIETLRSDSTEVTWRVRLTDNQTAGARIALDSETAETTGDDAAQWADFYFLGTVQSFEVTPSLSDSMQATFSVSINGDFEGPYAYDAAANVSGSTAGYDTPA